MAAVCAHDRNPLHADLAIRAAPRGWAASAGGRPPRVDGAAGGRPPRVDVRRGWTASAGGRAPRVDGPEPAAPAIAAEAGVDTLRQRGQGLNQGLREARDVAVARSAPGLVVLPVDLPLLSPASLATLVQPLRERAPGGAVPTVV